MRELTDKEKEFFKKLEEHMDLYVAKYREDKQRELSKGRREQLREELKDLEDYLAQAGQGLVDDLLVNIQYKGRKAEVLRELLAQ